jgi:hypothetical protein
MAQSQPTAITPAPRADGRLPDQLRAVRFQNNIAPYATGSTLIEWGNTRVICGVTVEDSVPRWMKEQGVTGGWITAEYSMLPYSTLQRKQRDITKGKIDGRSKIRLIGRRARSPDLSLAPAPSGRLRCCKRTAGPYGGDSTPCRAGAGNTKAVDPRQAARSIPDGCRSERRHCPAQRCSICIRRIRREVDLNEVMNSRANSLNSGHRRRGEPAKQLAEMSL